MEHLATGRFSIQITETRLDMTVDVPHTGPVTYGFDRERAQYTRDGLMIYPFSKIQGVEAKTVWGGPFTSHYMLVVNTTGGPERLYIDPDRAKVEALAAQITDFVFSDTPRVMERFQRAVAQSASVVPRIPTDLVAAGATTYPTPSTVHLAFRTSMPFGTIFGGIPTLLALASLLNGNLGGAVFLALTLSPFIAFGYFLARRELEKVRRWQQIYAHQIPLTVVVSGIWTNQGRGAHGALEYAYEDATGRLHQARSQNLSMGEIGRWQVGDTAEIIVHREAPDENLLISMWPVEAPVAAATA